MENEISDEFQKVIERLEAACVELQGGDEKEEKSDPEFKLDVFWIKITQAAKKVSKEVTALAVAVSGSFIDKRASQALLKNVEDASLKLLTTFYTLPKAKGLTLWRDVHDAIVDIFKNLISMLKTLKGDNADGSKDYAQSTAIVWTACKDVIENLPRNNVNAVLNVLHKEEAMIVDAIQEIEDEFKHKSLNRDSADEHWDNSEVWSNQDRELLPPCIGLMKTARSCVKRVLAAVRKRGKWTTETEALDLDDVANTFTSLTPAVDELVLTVYPPMDKKAVRDVARVLVNLVQSLLQMVRKSHFITEQDHDWLNFLLRAVDHNNNRLQPLLSV